MLVRDSRTSSANGAFGRHDRQDNAGMRLVNCRVVVTVERSFLMQVKELPTNNLFIYCFGRRVRGQVSPRRNLWASLFSEWPLWRFQRVPRRPRRCTPVTAMNLMATATQLRLRSTITQVQPMWRRHRMGMDHWFTQHQSTRRLLPTQRRRRRPAITQRGQSWFRSRYMTTHPVIGGAKDLTRPTLSTDALLACAGRRH